MGNEKRRERKERVKEGERDKENNISISIGWWKIWMCPLVPTSLFKGYLLGLKIVSGYKIEQVPKPFFWALFHNCLTKFPFVIQTVSGVKTENVFFF